MSDQKPPTGGGTQFDRWLKALEINPKMTIWVKVVIIGVAAGALFLNAGSLFGLKGGEQPPARSSLVSNPSPAVSDELARLEQEMSDRLAGTLSAIAGAGKVRVSVQLAAGPSITPVTDVKDQNNTTEEYGPDGSRRVTKTQDHDVTTVGGKGGASDAVAVLSKSGPRIAGVLIVADGADHSVVKMKLFKAAVTVLGVSPELVQVEAAEGK